MEYEIPTTPHSDAMTATRKVMPMDRSIGLSVSNHFTIEEVNNISQIKTYLNSDNDMEFISK